MSDNDFEPPFTTTIVHHVSDSFRLMVESVKDYAIFMLDPIGNVASWNPGAERIKGYKAEEIIGRHFSCFYTPADRATDHPQQVLGIALAQGRFGEEGQRVRKDGSLFWASVTITALKDHFGQHVGFAKVTQDISLRKAAEDSLRASEDRYRCLVEMMPDAVFVNLDGRIAFCNSAFARLVGVSRAEELLGTPVLDLFAERYRDTVLGRIEATKREGSVPVLEEEIVRRDGANIPVEVVASLIRYQERDAILVCLHDLSGRRQAEETTLRLASIIEGSEDAIISSNLDGAITSWNPAAERIFGHSASEILGKPIKLIIPASRIEEYKGMVGILSLGKRVHPFETVRRRKDGQLIDVSVSVSPVRSRSGKVFGASAIAQDITEKKRLQEQFRQAQKMDAIGRLAGGVAHDFNNLLTVITGYSEVLLTSLTATDETRALVTEIRNAGERAASLTRQLLTFSRKQVLEPRVLDLNAIVADSERLLVRLLGEDIEVKTKLAAELGRVNADPAQLEQVIVNLSINARDAMPNGGKLTIETADAELDESYCRTHPQVRPGPYALLAVSDTGTGMDEATRLQIFEPFFTTKDQGKGTGLGLAMVYGLITNSGGHIDVYSEPGMGATFKVYLPLAHEALSTRKSLPSVTLMPKGDETVLLVEDEDAVRGLARHALQTCGYNVLEASNGREALEVARGYAGPIHLLATDVVMPHMGGRLAAEQVTAIKPGVKVLFLSGYTDDAVVRHGILAAEMAFLQKPFTPSSLARKVRDVLDTDPTPLSFGTGE